MQITMDAWASLTRDNVRSFIAEHLNDDPAALALIQSRPDFPYALAATQVKYLQRAKKKLPSWYQVQAIIPPLAYEQASSERAAALKYFTGERCLDLTLGLGIDTAHWKTGFKEVHAVERDSSLIRAAGYNFNLLGLEGINLHHSTAEEFVKSYTGPTFDMVYADPARRDARGKRVHDLSDTQPNIVQLLPELRRIAQTLVVKISPLFDLKAAIRQLPGLCKLLVHSLDNEVKEVLLQIDLGQSLTSPLESPKLEIVRDIGSEVQRIPISNWQKTAALSPVPANPSYVYEPDVAFYKGQCLPQWFADQNIANIGLTHAMGFFLGEGEQWKNFPGRSFSIKAIHPFKPKQLKRYFKAQPIQVAHIIRRNFPLTVKQIRQQLNMQEGGDAYLICTEVNGKKQLFECERLR